MEIKKTVLILTLISSLFSLLTGCNTVQGAGEDIQAGGKAIERAAK